MKAFLPLWAEPLNIFQIHGTMCCPAMRKSYAAKLLVDKVMCYDARGIHDANVLVLWGSFSTKLVELTNDLVDDMISRRAILHIRGCDMRINNDTSTSALDKRLALNAVFSQCVITPKDARALILEVRQCLRA